MPAACVQKASRPPVSPIQPVTGKSRSPDRAKRNPGLASNRPRITFHSIRATTGILPPECQIPSPLPPGEGQGEGIYEALARGLPLTLYPHKQYLKHAVIPAKAGIQPLYSRQVLDSRFHGNDMKCKPYQAQEAGSPAHNWLHFDHLSGHGET